MKMTAGEPRKLSLRRLKMAALGAQESGATRIQAIMDVLHRKDLIGLVIKIAAILLTLFI